MKPNFALNLSHEGISLLHRAKSGWLRVGEVSLDDPDLGTRLKLLRHTASDLENGGLTTKLVIPNSQILYTEIDAPGPDNASRIAQIRDGLVGLTPYDVRELVFDWHAEGDTARVAVVARETLHEAETFAAEYRFNPVSFVALPVNGAFAGEPFFGPTRHAASLLSGGDVIEPDGQKIEVLGSSKAPVPEPADPAPQVPDPVEEAASDAPADQAQEEAAADFVVSEDRADPVARISEPVAFAPHRDAPPTTGPGGDAGRGRARLNLGESPENAIADAPPASVGITAPSLDLDAPEPSDAEDGTQEPVFQSSAARAAAGIASLYASRPAPEERAEPQDRPPATPLTLSQDARAAPARTPMPVTAPHTAEANEPARKPARKRRSTRRTAQDAKVALVGTINKLGSNARRIARKPEPFGTTEAEAEALTVFGARGHEGTRGRTRHLGLVLTALLLVALSVLAVWSLYHADGNGTRLVATQDEAPGLQAELPTAELALAPAPAPESEIAAPTPSAPVGGEVPVDAPPDEQTVMAAAVEEALRDAVAADGDLPDEAEGIAQSDIVDPVPTLASGEAISSAVPDIAARDADGGAVDLAEGLAPDAAPAGTAEGSEQLALLGDPQAPLADPEAAIAREVVVPEPIVSRPERQPPPTRAEAEARYAASGIWQRDPEPLNDIPGGGDPIDNLYIASIDPAVSGGEAVPLPDPRALATDARPPVLAPPAPLGTAFDFDDRGLIRATSGGAVTPEGVQVFAGRPPVVPGPRPSDLEVPLDETRAPGEEPLRSQAPDPGQDGLSEETELARLGGFSRAELAAIRPQVRPLSLGERRGSLLEPPAAETEEAAAPAPEIQTASTDPVFVGVDATTLAVAASRAPPLRPSNFAGVVEQALREATRQPPQPLPDASGNRSKPVLTATVAAPRMPPVPSRASVAKQATVKNAINLRKVNLIGVYGSPSKRRALVRLSSGKYVKVEVGDRVDGGRVSSIGDNELRYIKSGRSHTLKMPKS